jgi:hypothetical protein
MGEVQNTSLFISSTLQYKKERVDCPPADRLPKNGCQLLFRWRRMFFFPSILRIMRIGSIPELQPLLSQFPNGPLLRSSQDEYPDSERRLPMPVYRLFCYTPWTPIHRLVRAAPCNLETLRPRCLESARKDFAQL